MSVTIFGLGAYFYLSPDEHDKDVSSLGWLPLVSKLCILKPSNNSMYFIRYFNIYLSSTALNFNF